MKNSHLYCKGFSNRFNICSSGLSPASTLPSFLSHSVWFYRKSKKESAPARMVLGLCIWYSWASRNPEPSPAGFGIWATLLRMQASVGETADRRGPVFSLRHDPLSDLLARTFLETWLLPRDCCPKAVRLLRRNRWKLATCWAQVDAHKSQCFQFSLRPRRV